VTTWKNYMTHLPISELLESPAAKVSRICRRALPSHTSTLSSSVRPSTSAADIPARCTPGDRNSWGPHWGSSPIQSSRAGPLWRRSALQRLRQSTHRTRTHPL